MTNAAPRSDSIEAVSLRDGGIRWIFYFRKADVPERELWTIEAAEREEFLRIAVTFGSVDSEARVYRSTTIVHLWQIGRLPSSVTWRTVFVHVFTHEPLHHVISRFLTEDRQPGNQEWVIGRLGDGRWW